MLGPKLKRTILVIEREAAIDRLLENFEIIHTNAFSKLKYVYKMSIFKIFDEKLDVDAQPKVDAYNLGYKKGGGTMVRTWFYDNAPSTFCKEFHIKTDTL
jgi:hypothetical protein